MRQSAPGVFVRSVSRKLSVDTNLLVQRVGFGRASGLSQELCVIGHPLDFVATSHVASVSFQCLLKKRLRIFVALLLPVNLSDGSEFFGTDSYFHSLILIRAFGKVLRLYRSDGDCCRLPVLRHRLIKLTLSSKIGSQVLGVCANVGAERSPEATNRIVIRHNDNVFIQTQLVQMQDSLNF